MTGPEPGATPAADEPPLADPRTAEMAAAIAELESLEARAGRSRNLWVTVSRVGTLGWLVALPIVGGALLGHLLDRRLDTGLTFALALMVLGIVLAGFTLWRHAQEFQG